MPCFAALLVAVVVVPLGWPAGGRAEVEPLQVPRGPGPDPEEHADMEAVERIVLGLEAQAERGFRERPIQAWALLQEGRRSSDPTLIERALAAAPDTPAIRFEALREGVIGTDPFGFVLAFGRNLPALVWLLTVVAVGVGLSILTAAAAASLVGFLRTLTLHGHALGHRLPMREPLSWPGALAAVALIAVLPVLGAGLALVVGVAGALAIVRLSRVPGWTTAGLLALAGLVLGPGVDMVTRLVTQPVASPLLTATWRFDRGQPLPEDAALLEAAVAERGDADPFLVYGFANALKHLGEIERAEEVLRSRPQATSELLEARSLSLMGILRLAEGDVDGALTWFERARAIGESATVLYNLSQAYARNVDLNRRSELYGAAQAVDAELVGEYAALQGTNVHRYVIQEPLPLWTYVSRALEPSRESGVMALVVRERVLGGVVPIWGWALLPGLGMLGLALRRDGPGRCKRCDRPLCRHCAPKRAGGNCTRCDRLFSPGTKIDARVRKQQADLDRRRQRRLGLARGFAAFLVPGLGPWLDGRILAGTMRVLATGLAIGLVVSVCVVPVPLEVAGFWVVMPVLAAGVALPLWLLELASLHRTVFGKARP